MSLKYEKGDLTALTLLMVVPIGAIALAIACTVIGKVIA